MKACADPLNLPRPEAAEISNVIWFESWGKWIGRRKTKAIKDKEESIENWIQENVSEFLPQLGLLALSTLEEIGSNHDETEDEDDVLNQALLFSLDLLNFL